MQDWAKKQMMEQSKMEHETKPLSLEEKGKGEGERGKEKGRKMIQKKRNLLWDQGKMENVDHYS